jgi:hypothetical protein
MTGSQQALIIFAVIVGILVYVKGNSVDIPFIAGGQATANGLGAQPDISPGDQS